MLDTFSGRLLLARRIPMKPRVLALLGSLLAVVATPVLAHHSFAAEYDNTQPVKVTGVLTRVEWTNPHVWFYLDVKDDRGGVTNWGFSGARLACCNAGAFPKTA